MSIPNVSGTSSADDFPGEVVPGRSSATSTSAVFPRGRRRARLIHAGQRHDTPSRTPSPAGAAVANAALDRRSAAAAGEIAAVGVTASRSSSRRGGPRRRAARSPARALTRRTRGTGARHRLARHAVFRRLGELPCRRSPSSTASRSAAALSGAALTYRDDFPGVPMIAFPECFLAWCPAGRRLPGCRG